MDDVQRAKEKDAKPMVKQAAPVLGNKQEKGRGDGDNGEKQENGKEEEEEEALVAGDVGAGQCIWLARVRPEDCENLVRYTVLQGKVVKPERQLRGGFDRCKGLLSW
jgi:glycerol-3-phosphate O-acyltransferase/dihydroxyacetone phosphate acyltransferase